MEKNIEKLLNGYSQITSTLMRMVKNGQLTYEVYYEFLGKTEKIFTSIMDLKNKNREVK